MTHPADNDRSEWPDPGAEYEGPFLISQGGPVLEEGRRLASARDDLIAQGVDPGELDIPIAPTCAPPVETVHRCPLGDDAVTPCCRRSPFDLPRTDRMTEDDAAVTCPIPPGHTPYYVNLAGVTICEECGVPWDEAHPDTRVIPPGQDQP